MAGGRVAASPTLGALGLVAAAATFSLLWLVSQPFKLDSKIKTINNQLTQAQALEARPGGAGAWRPGTICQDQSEAVGSYGSVVRRLADQAQTPLTDLKIIPSARRTSTLTATEITIAGRASYGNVVQLLANLSQQTPVLFVDAVDLQNRAQGVEFSIKGAVWCWALPDH
jgi:hypothetical protein